MLELFGENSPGGDLLVIGVDKAAILEREALEEFAYQKRKLLAFSGVELIM